MESNTVGEEVPQMGKIGNGRQIKAENSSNPSSPNQKVSDIISSTLPIGIGSRRSAMDINSLPSSSNQKDSIANNQEDQLESTKAEMGEVREENERLKTILAKIVQDYQSLQMHFFDIVQQEQAKKITETTFDQEMEEPEMVSLSLGTATSVKKEENKMGHLSKIKDEKHLKEGLSLGLDCKFQGKETSGNQSPENSLEESKEEEIAQAWPPSKATKTARSAEDDISQQTQVKKTRVSVRARCETTTMNDGCQWRKYGQKISKGNPCPRAYYRCTVAPACPVRKQVQRCAEDMSILITTYEGTHNHPLPISATAMASTTSAAACMLASGSSTSRSSSSSANIHGLNFSLSEPSRSKSFFLPNPSMPSLSYPTITLDLTSPSSTSSSQFSRFSSNYSHNPRYSSTTFNFSSDPNTSQNSWSNNSYLSYGSQNHNKNPIGSANFLRNSQEQMYQPYLQKPNFSPAQQSLTETIAAATKAITSDPSFRSALAAALTSIVGGGSGGGGGGIGGAHSHGNGGGAAAAVENVVQNLLWPETLSTIPSYSSSANGNGCGTSYLNRPSASSSNSQQGNLMFLPPALPFSSSKSASASPVDNREDKG